MTVRLQQLTFHAFIIITSLFALMWTTGLMRWLELPGH